MFFKRCFLFLTVFLLLAGMMPTAQAADKSLLISFSADVYQNRANSVIKEINRFRKENDLPALTAAGDLEKVALQRAGELFVLFDHNRPNMTEFTTAVEESKALNGWIYANELIAAGFSKANEVADEWISQHADILLDSDYTHIGAACIRVKNSANEFYWCVVLLTTADSYKAKAAATIKAGQSKTIKAELSSAMFSRADKSHKRFELRVNDISLKSKDTATPSIYLYDRYGVQIGKVNVAQGLTYKSSNSKVFTVNSKGEIKKGKSGEGTLTVSFPNLDTATCTVTVGGSTAARTATTTSLSAAAIKTATPDFAAKAYTHHTTLSAYLKGADGYVLYRSTAKNGTYTKYTEQVTSDRWNVKLPHEELTRTYYYKVRAFINNGGKRVYSEYTTPIKVNP